MRIHFEEAKKVLKEKLMKHGVPSCKAEKVAHEMARNSLEGVYTHGINRFSRLIGNIDQGIVVPEAEPQLLNGFGGIENYEGNLGLGIVNASFCMDRAITLAEEHGIGLVAIRNTNHWLRAATYGYQAADRGLASICFTNTMPNMPTWGAVDSRLGNNPFMMAFPGKNGKHLRVDCAMSQFSYGALELARLQGRQMRIDAGFDQEGKLTKDPSAVIATQRILPAGYWKGAAISFMEDIFASALSMGRCVAEVGRLKGDEHGVSQVFIAIDYKKISGTEIPEEIIADAIADLKSSIPDSDSTEIVYTGEQLYGIREENLKGGIPVDEGVWQKILLL